MGRMMPYANATETGQSERTTPSCQFEVKKFGYTGASVARFVRVTTSLVNRYAASGDLLKLRR